MNRTKRSELHPIPVRGSHDWDTVGRILDVGFLAHVGFCVSAQPFVIPMIYGREGDKLYLHGSAASRMLGELEIGISARAPKSSQLNYFFASASRFCFAQSLSGGTAFMGGPPSVPQAQGPSILASVMQEQDLVFRQAQT